MDFFFQPVDGLLRMSESGAESAQFTGGYFVNSQVRHLTVIQLRILFQISEKRIFFRPTRKIGIPHIIPQIEADTIVLAAGSISDTKLYQDLKGKAPEIHCAGDCVAPRTIRDAIAEGYCLGLEI